MTTEELEGLSELLHKDPLSPLDHPEDEEEDNDEEEDEFEDDEDEDDED